MNRKPFPFVRLAAVCLGESLLLGGLWLGIRHETQTVNRIVNDVAELRDPSPFRAALLGHLGKIHLSLKGYLRSPDPSLEKQVGDSRKDFEALLPEFVRQNPKLFPQAAAEEIQRTFRLYKEAIDHTMDGNTRRMARRDVLDGNFAQVLFLIEHNLKPIIRKEQADGEERRDAVLNIENQSRAWHENLSRAWAQPSEAAKALTFENDNRGQTFLELYGRMELLARERKTQKEIHALWLANSDLARQSFVTETLVDQSEKAMDVEREQVVGTLNQYLPAMPPVELESKKQTILQEMRLHLIGACAIGLVGLLSFIGTVLFIYRLLRAKPAPADGVFRAEPGVAGESTLQMDLQGVIAAWSSAAEKLYGFTAKEMVGKSVGTLFESESEIGRLDHELHVAKKTTFETTHKTKTGGPIPVRIQFQPVSDSAGRTTAIGLVCVRR